MVTLFVRRGARLSRAALAVGLGAVAGCYRYVPVPVTELAPDMNVRMQLSAVAIDRLRTASDSLTRLLDGFSVSGTVSRLGSDTLLLAVPTSYMEANVRLKTQLHPLTLVRSDVLRVESRRLDRVRTTWIGVALGVTAAASAAYVLNRGGRSTGSIPKPVDPSELLIP
jgi:hypothetical protein